MNVKKNCKYALATVTSMGVRITPVERQSVHTSHLFEMQATSAESNVLNIAASLGAGAKVLTRFVEDSAIASFIKSELRRRGIFYDFGAGTFWGWNVLGSLIGIGPLVYTHKLFKAMNLLCGHYNVNG